MHEHRDVAGKKKWDGQNSREELDRINRILDLYELQHKSR